MRLDTNLPWALICKKLEIAFALLMVCNKASEIALLFPLRLPCRLLDAQRTTHSRDRDHSLAHATALHEHLHRLYLHTTAFARKVSCAHHG